jgi:phage gp36-like protein
MPVSYCQPSDIRDNVAGTDSGTGTCAQLSDDQLSAAVAKASAKVSAYAGTSWMTDANTPTVTIPDLVVNLTVAIGSFYATLTYRKGKDLSAFDPVYLGYLDAMATLKDIINGNIVVAPVPPGEAPVAGGKVINTLPRVFVHADSGTLPDGRGGIMPAGAPGSRLIDGWGR